ncbi:uncharacterized protein LOC113388396 [Ctenocephalides felis]|uniref:uncharacterized protein LOC113388396 n=1 Tax=Ctenocephalides felis TaxID=7515 RepID=UPI000E6E275A|nr:uncharacterized protein LOC113388396 [Ctenocephalides felis]
MREGFLSAVYVVANTGKHEPLPEFYKNIQELQKTVNDNNVKGHLTSKGKEQMYIMGARLKRHYSKILEGIHDSKNINVTAMDNPRSLLSANLLQAGFLGQSRDGSLKKDWKPKDYNKTKIHESYEKALKAFYDTDNCKQLFSEKVKTYLGGANTTYSALKSKVQEHFPQVKDEDMWKLYNHFLSLKNDNKELPNWLTYDDLLDMKEYVDTYIRTFSKTVELKQLSSGKYVKEFVNSLDKFRTRPHDAGPKMRIFAAEEMSFAAIVAGLGGDKNFKICDEDKPFGWPKNGAMIIGELHTESSTRHKFFKLLYWDPDEERPQQLHLNNCKRCEWLQYMMYRHGDRTPDDLEMNAFPNYENVNKTWYPIGKGHLTNDGVLHMFKLGEAVRSKYSDLFQGVFNMPTYETVRTFTTEYPRTRASALAYLAGLLPPAQEQQWGRERGCNGRRCREPELASLWRPVTYVPDEKLNLAVNLWANCPAFFNETSRVQNSQEFQDKFSRYHRLMQVLSANTGKEIKSPIEVWTLRTLYETQEAAGIEKPTWVSDNWNDINEYTDLVFQSMFHNDIQKRFGAGVILKKILDDSKAKARNADNLKERKMFVYSGHETTLVPLYAALAGSGGFIDRRGFRVPTHIPEFTAALAIELHRSVSSGEHFVKFFYTNGDRNFHPLKRSDCPELCPLDELVRLTQALTYSTETIQEQCNPGATISTRPPSGTTPSGTSETTRWPTSATECPTYPPTSDTRTPFPTNTPTSPTTPTTTPTTPSTTTTTPAPGTPVPGFPSFVKGPIVFDESPTPFPFGQKLEVLGRKPIARYAVYETSDTLLSEPIVNNNMKSSPFIQVSLNDDDDEAADTYVKGALFRKGFAKVSNELSRKNEELQEPIAEVTVNDNVKSWPFIKASIDDEMDGAVDINLKDTILRDPIAELTVNDHKKFLPVVKASIDDEINGARSRNPRRSNGISDQEQVARAGNGISDPQQGPRAGNGISDQEQVARAGNGISDQEQVSKAGNGISDQEQVARAGNGISDQEQVARAGNGISDQEQVAKAGNGISDQEQVARAGNGISDQEQVARAGNGISDQEQVAKAGNGISDQEQVARAGNGISDPQERPRAGNGISDPQERPRAGNGISDPQEGPRAGNEISDPEVGPRAGNGISDQEQVAKAGNGISDQEKVARAGNGISDPQEGPRAGNGISDPQEGPRAGNGISDQKQVARAGNGISDQEQVARAGNGISDQEHVARAGNGISDQQQEAIGEETMKDTIL